MRQDAKRIYTAYTRKYGYRLANGTDAVAPCALCESHAGNSRIATELLNQVP